jgi:hypothetical protein
MTTELINLRTKDYNGKSGYFYYKQEYGSRFEYIGCKVRFRVIVLYTSYMCF